MRAVSLSNKEVQRKITTSFIPLKVSIPYGTEKFPLDWPALKVWQDTYQRMGGPKTSGITACTVVSPDLKVELGSTGSAFVWEMFDSIAYNADKFAGMLDNALKRFERGQKIRGSRELSEKERASALREHRLKVLREVGREGRFHFPPPGFSIEGAKELFRLTGDLKDGK